MPDVVGTICRTRGILAQGNVCLSGDFRHIRIAGSWRQALPVGLFISPTSHVTVFSPLNFDVDTDE